MGWSSGRVLGMTIQIASKGLALCMTEVVGIANLTTTATATATVAWTRSDILQGLLPRAAHGRTGSQLRSGRMLSLCELSHVSSYVPHIRNEQVGIGRSHGRNEYTGYQNQHNTAASEKVHNTAVPTGPRGPHELGHRCSFSRDGQLVASASNGKTVRF